jgi:phosphoglycolate phosphatase
MAPQLLPTVVFDLDGTLVDTAPDLVSTLNAILVAEGMESVTREAVIGMIGSGARVMIESAFAAAGRSLTPARLDRLFSAFLTRYDAHLVDASLPYPGVEAALDRLAADGWRLAVCTNKREAPARKVLNLLGLGNRFAAIAGQDTFGVSKPDPRHLTETIRIAGGDPARAVMVGDSLTDVDTANAAGIPVVAVSFGYSPVPVAELRANRVIDTFDELDDAVAALSAVPAAGRA